jgi:hypothetical protein
MIPALSELLSIEPVASNGAGNGNGKTERPRSSRFQA